MARDLLEQDPGSADFLAQAEGRLKTPLGRLMLEGPEPELQATENAQPAILFHSLALLRLLASMGLKPSLVAGHSMGEFAGLVAAEALEPLDALEAVQARGWAMSAAAPAASGMIAVLGLPDADVERLCAGSDGLVVVANYNAPGQIVISGKGGPGGTPTGLVKKTPPGAVLQNPEDLDSMNALLGPTHG